MNVKQTLLGLTAAAAACSMSASVFAQGDESPRRDPAAQAQPADQTQQQTGRNRQRGDQAQQQQNDRNRQQGEQGLRPGQDRDSQQEVTQNLAAWLALGNYCEVQLGQLATERAQNQQVKQYAQRAVQDHQRALEQLRKLAPQVDPSEWQSSIAADSGRQARVDSTTNRDPSQASNDPSRQRNPRDNAASRQGSRGQGQYDEMSRIGMQAGLNKIQLTRELLSEKSGAKFDECYIGQQILAHTCMLGELRAMSNAGSPEFQQFVAQAEKSTEQHLQQAKEIAKSLETSRQGNEGQRNQRGQRENRNSGERNQSGAQDQSERSRPSEFPAAPQ